MKKKWGKSLIAFFVAGLLMMNVSCYNGDFWTGASSNAESSVNTYTVTVIGGSGSGEYEEGEEVEINADSVKGHRFLRWIDDEGEEISNSSYYTFTITEDVTLTAVTARQYSVEVIGGWGSFDYVEGEPVTVKAFELQNRRFVGWNVDGVCVSTEAEYTFAAYADITLQAMYIEFHWLTIIGGSGSGVYDVGEKVTVSAVIPEGKRFVKWLDSRGEAFSIEQSFEITIGLFDLEFTAVFEDLETD